MGDAAIKKYGWDNFELIIEENIPEDMLDFLEVSMIYSCDSIGCNGYNIDVGGNKNKHLNSETKNKISKKLTGIKRSKETKLKISKTKMGDKNPMWKHFKAKNPFYGKRHTEGSINKNRKAHFENKNRLGHYHSEATKLKISQSLIERNKRKFSDS